MSSHVRPDFFVIGASKCGTTGLCELLGNHPQVFLPTPKEPHYFSRGEEWNRSLAWYNAFFAEAAGYALVGERSTSYADVGIFPGVEERLAGHCPDARIIYIVRHPLERMVSQWMQLRSVGTATAGFNTMVREFPEMIESNLYWRNISAFRKHFPDDRILVLFLEDFRHDPPATLARCFRFLALDPGVELDDPHRPRNVRASKREDGSVLRSLRSTRWFDATRDALVPRRLRPWLRRLVTSRVPEPRWEPDTRRWAAERVASDGRRFLRHFGKPTDFWSLDG